MSCPASLQFLDKVVLWRAAVVGRVGAMSSPWKYGRDKVMLMDVGCMDCMAASLLVLCNTIA
jgi:hypothetical protein